jgi:hypothetical protein
MCENRAMDDNDQSNAKRRKLNGSKEEEEDEADPKKDNHNNNGHAADNIPPPLGLKRVKPTPSSFIPLLQWIGRTPEKLMPDYDLENSLQAKSVEDRKTEIRKRKRSIKRLRSAFTVLGMERKCISKHCLEVLAATHEGLLLKRQQPLRLPVKIRRQNSTNDEDVAPGETVILNKGDVLKIFDYEFQVAQQDQSLQPTTDTVDLSQELEEEPMTEGTSNLENNVDSQKKAESHSPASMAVLSPMKTAEEASTQQVDTTSHTNSNNDDKKRKTRARSKKSTEVTMTPEPPPSSQTTSTAVVAPAPVSPPKFLSYWNSEWLEHLDGNDSRPEGGEASIANDLSTTSLDQSLPPPTDMKISLAQIYWKALNSSTPYIGEMYLHTVLDAANQVPSLHFCKDLIQLLTWGPKLPPGCYKAKKDDDCDFLKKDTEPPFYWDGPRLYKALGYFERILKLHPRIMLPRLVTAAGRDWWKSIVDEIVLNNSGTQHDLQHAISKDSGQTGASKERAVKQQVIERLRMQSCSLQALIFLLQSSLDMYQEMASEQQENHRHQRHSSPERSDDEESDDDDTVDEESEGQKKSSFDPASFGLIKEILDFGAKAALRAVAQSMAHVWTIQKSYLVCEMADEPILDLSLWEAHSDAAKAMAVNLASLFGLVWKVATLEQEQDAGWLLFPDAATRRRRPRRGRTSTSDGLTEKVALEILWNALDLQIQQRIPYNGKHSSRSKRKKKENVPLDPKQSLLLRWVCSLEPFMGHSFVENLADYAGISDEYDNFMEM